MRNIIVDFKPYNPNKLHEELHAALGADFIGVSSAPERLIIHLADVAAGKESESGDQDEATALAVMKAHNPDFLTAEQQNYRDFLTAWRNGVLAGKTPAQIYQALGNQIDGWASLAAAKADLRAWLPLMGAALWYLLRGNLEDS